MNPDTIHIVWAENGYEGRDIVAIFREQAHAKALASKLNALAESEPDCPDQRGTDGEWVEYDRRHKEWYALWGSYADHNYTRIFSVHSHPLDNPPVDPVA